MPTEILMPALSPTMEKGNLAKWLKKEGDVVKAGQVIAEIETDKATMEVEAVDEGTIAKILIPAGSQGVKVNTVIAILAEEGESVEAALKAIIPPAANAPAAAPASAATSSPAAPAKSASAPVAHVTQSGGRVIASPLAKRIAEQSGINLQNIRGT